MKIDPIIKIPCSLLTNKQFVSLLPSSRLVYITMKIKLGLDSLLVQWSHKKLAELTDMSRHTVVSSTQELIDHNFITVIKPGGRWVEGTTYRMNPEYLEPDAGAYDTSASLEGLPNGKGSVYFIGNVEQNIVKIGYTERGIESRLDGLQTGNAYELTILKVISKTNMEGESIVQSFFNDYHMRGEWYEIKGELAEYLSLKE